MRREPSTRIWSPSRAAAGALLACSMASWPWAAILTSPSATVARSSPSIRSRSRKTASSVRASRAACSCRAAATSHTSTNTVAARQATSIGK
jgi:integral membrane sensor domain MASE1